MSFYEFFHRFFESGHGGQFRPPDVDENNVFDRSRHSPWSEDRPQGNSYPDFNFNVVTDPFEVHKMFDQMFNDMMKSFSLFDGFHGSDLFVPPGAPHHHHPAVQEPESQNPRDYYLKPGLKQDPNDKTAQSGSERKSGPMMPRVDIVIPQAPLDSSRPNNFSFRSVIRRTVTLPDGTVKSEEIIRNEDGTEERTQSEVLPDGQASVGPFFDPSFINPRGFFQRPKLPEANTVDPRNELLKPGYERPNPYGEKVDKDLDQHILESGIQSLPHFSEDPQVVNPNETFSFRSLTKRSVTLPNGAVETEEILRNPDGTEQRTITQTYPDGSSPDKLPSLSSDSHSEMKNQRSILEDSKTAVSITLRGVKDFIDILFK